MSVTPLKLVILRGVTISYEFTYLCKAICSFVEVLAQFLNSLSTYKYAPFRNSSIKILNAVAREPADEQPRNMDGLVGSRLVIGLRGTVISYHLV